MTPKGEDLTVKGEFQMNPFDFKQDISVHFHKDSPYHTPDQTAQQIENASATAYCQMIFVLKGALVCGLEKGRRSTAIIEARQHNLMLVHPDRSLSSASDESCEVVFVNLSLSFLSRYMSNAHPLHQSLTASKARRQLLLFSEQNMHITPEIISILYSMENSPHSGFCGKLFLESKVIELLVQQLSQAESAGTEDNVALKKEEKDKMHEVKDILVDNFESPPSLIALAHMVGTNEFNLKKNFKIAFGTTVYGYLNQYKMELAKSILIKGDAKISEVSAKMGYKHATHFTSAFKKYFGYLPNKIKMLWLVMDQELITFLFTA